MRSLAIGGTLVVVAAMLPTHLAAQQPYVAVRSDTTYGCILCHTTERVAMTTGVHAEHGVNCVACHGGDPTARALPAAHSKGFTGKLDKVATARLCGSCHSDPNKMRQYGLPTGQLAEFRTSKHGQLLLERHNQDAPTCTDCHETHVIYPPDDARSMVYPTNIPGTCGRCHTDSKLMAKYHLRTDQLDQFKASAHGVALFQKQNFAAPSCIGCHGAHSALPPTVAEIASVCGRCHSEVAERFAASPHGPASAKARMPACLSCHENHSTEPVPVDSIPATCEQCHKGDARVHTTAVTIEHDLQHASDDMASAERAIGRLQLAGRRIGDYEFRYQTARTAYLQLGQAQHALNLDTLDALGRQVRSISIDLDAAAEAVSEQRWEHKLILAPVWFLTLSAVTLGWLALRSLKGARGDRES